jgi:DNA polymerase-1
MITKFNVAGAITGRFTSNGGSLKNGFNAQQIPRNYQKLFNQPTEDTAVIDADYSTLELRLAAGIFGDEYMYKQLKEGRDLHTDIALSTTGKKLHPDGVIKDGDLWREVDKGEWVTSTDRTKAKAINFGFVFGMSADSFIPYAFTGYNLVYTKAEALAVRNKYFSMYKDIARHHDYVWSNYKDPKFIVTTALGRRVKPKMGTDGINTPIQGSGGECTKLAVHYLIKDNPDIPIIKYIYNVVHDCIYLRVPKDRAEELGVLLNKAMLKGWSEISKCSLFKYHDIPMIAEVEIYK